MLDLSAVSVTITSDGLLSLWIGLILFILSVLALLSGSLPDNPRSPVGDAMRKIVWPLFAIWILARVFIR